MSDDNKNENQPYEPENDQDGRQNIDDQEQKTSIETNYMESVKEMVNESDSIEKNDSGKHTQSKENSPAKNKTWLYVLLSGITGGAISAAIVLLLVFNGIIPSEQNSVNISAETEQESNPEVIQTIANEDAELSSSIEETSQAVVGVLNLQQQSIWE